jgi:hypothetical protein
VSGFAGGNFFATRIEHPAASHRRKKKRKADRHPEHLSAEIALWHRNALARPERHRLKGTAVLVKRHLAFGAAVDVIEHDARQSTPGKLSQVVDADDVWSCNPHHVIADF